jgi:pimeloyl-ACP methyl ester carboxylesterase
MHETKFLRRQFLGAAAAGIAGTQLVMLGAASAQAADPLSLTLLPVEPGTPGAHTSFGVLKQIDAGLLNVGYAEAGPVHGPAVLLLHGWPYDIHSYVDVAPLLAANGYRVIVPFLRGYGSTRFLSSETFRNGQQAVVALDVIALMDALKLHKAIIGGFDWGARTACIVAALWPERCTGLVSVSGYLIGNRAAALKPLPPRAELGWWYQYYFATPNGVLGYTANRYEFDKLIWSIVSPKWAFDEATYDRTAIAFNNPDHVAIVIHDYRWRISLADGESKYDDLEAKLAAAPVIAVPTITISSDFDGANAEGSSYAKRFTGKYSHRIFNGIGHNVPQEAPKQFAQAIIDVYAFEHGSS